MDEQSTLLGKALNCDCKGFYNIGLRIFWSFYAQVDFWQIDFMVFDQYQIKHCIGQMPVGQTSVGEMSFN